MTPTANQSLEDEGENTLEIVAEIDEDTSSAPKKKSYPRLGGGNQKSFKLSGRITRYIEARRLRHGVSQAEVVRGMLNERIDHEEMLEELFRGAIAEQILKR